jgi:hypothetical protein
VAVHAADVARMSWPSRSKRSVVLPAVKNHTEYGDTFLG